MIHWQYGAETGVTGHEWEAAARRITELKAILALESS